MWCIYLSSYLQKSWIKRKYLSAYWMLSFDILFSRIFGIYKIDRHLQVYKKKILFFYPNVLYTSTIGKIYTMPLFIIVDCIRNVSDLTAWVWLHFHIFQAGTYRNSWLIRVWGWAIAKMFVHDDYSPFFLRTVGRTVMINLTRVRLKF